MDAFKVAILRRVERLEDMVEAIVDHLGGVIVEPDDGVPIVWPDEDE